MACFDTWPPRGHETAMSQPLPEPDDSPRLCGPDIPGVPGNPAFLLHRQRVPAIPVLLAVPHAGRIYPPDLLARMRAPELACLRLEDRLADLLAREVAAATGACLLLAQAPRAMIDLNRAPDDLDHEMIADAPLRPALALAGAGKRARTGLGLVPRRLAGLGELWRERLPMHEVEARIAAIHRPWHQTLASTLHRLRDRWGAALLIDLHSMPPLGAGHGPGAAEIVLGDRFGGACGGALIRAGLHQLERGGRRVALNRPYAGGYALDRHGTPPRGLHAMQVEVCRATYLDETLREPGEGFAAMVRDLAGLVRRLAGELAVQAGGMAQAAE